ncbi:MAG TPA: hypothetical protein VNU71_12085 [Burkholderiaceae bacterium]|nr:hypothetical protein [Burkholderiaceae bacterium]
MSGRAASSLLAVLLLGGTTTTHAAPAVATLSADTPRAFGYSVGDVITRRIALDLPRGLALDEAALPRPGGRGRALELQRVELRRSWSGVPQELQLDYQVFLAPRETRVLEMPPVELRVGQGGQARTLRIDAWPVTVAPLTPPDAATREGLGELRPDVDPPPLDTAPLRTRLLIEAALAALLLAYLAQVYLVAPWSAQRRRPFGRAWPALRALPPAADAAQRRAAFERFHAALNETAGEALFAAGLGRFVAAQPRFAPLRDELARFFAASRDEFFAARPEAGDTRWLVALARRCRDAERGAA